MKPSAIPVESAHRAAIENCVPQFKNTFRSQEPNEEKLSPPSGFCFTHTGNLILADDFNHRIQIHDPDHKLIKSFGGKGKNPGYLHYPRGVAVDQKDNIFVADSWNHRVQKFDPEGGPLLTLGSCGEGKGLLNEPYDVFIDSDDNILVVERCNHRIQIFDPEGRSKGWVGGRGTTLEEELAHIFETPEQLFNSPAFEFPTSIASDGQGNYLIADSGNHRIIKFDPEWNLLFTFGERGKDAGQFEYPLCVSAGPNGLLYVADLNNDRVQSFTSTGLYLGQLKAAESLPLEAPGLTAVNASGVLYVGMTFDTRAPTFKTPEASEEDLTAERYKDAPEDPYILHHQARRAQQAGDRENALKLSRRAALQIIAGIASSNSSGKYETDLLLNFSRLALHAGDNWDAPLLLQSLDVFSRRLDAERQAVLATHEEWERAAVKHNQLLFAEQKQVLERREDPMVFNKELFQAEILSRNLFRKLRHQFYVYRKTAEQGSEFYDNAINSGLSGSALKSCTDVMDAHFSRICDVVNHLLEAKEKNEQVMVESFGETQSLDGKWETFLLRSNTNARIMDLLRQFHFEIRGLLANVKGAAIKYPESDEIKNSLRRRFMEPRGSEKFLKILLGFQQEWPFYRSLEMGLKDLLDLWMTRWGTALQVGDPQELQMENLRPVPFDSEGMILKEMTPPLLIEGMPLRKTGQGISCGNQHVSSKIISDNPDDFIQTLKSVLDNARDYESKYLEGLQQLEALTKQKLELETKLNRANPQDKQSPITLQNQISVVTFQISLLRRMVPTMEINEAKNLWRLAFGTSLWLDSQGQNDRPETASFIEEIISFQTDLENKIHRDSRERKTLAFENSRLDGILNAMEENNDIGDLNRTLQVKDQAANIQPMREMLDASLNRRFKIRTMIRKIMDFKDDRETRGALSMETTASYPFKFSFANGATCHPLQPYGIAQTREGDFIAADYENHRVVRFSSRGIYKNHFGGWGNAPGFFKYPIDVQVDGQGFLYVADEKNKRIQKFTGEGKFLLSFGDRESEDLRLGPIFSLSIDQRDQVWVADPSHNRIQIHSSDGQWVRSLQNENLSEPVGVCCLENGEVLIGDKSSTLIKRLGPDGNMIRGLRREGLGFDDIYFLTQHPDHGIFTTDYWNNQILHLNFQLDVISVYKNPGKRAGQFGRVGGLVLAKNQLAVADPENFRVQVLECPILRSGS